MGIFSIAKDVLHHQLLQNSYQYHGYTNDSTTLQFYLIGFKVTPCSSQQQKMLSIKNVCFENFCIQLGCSCESITNIGNIRYKVYHRK
jgi:hypothetical protein